jgi:hypothetical protein
MLSTFCLTGQGNLETWCLLKMFGEKWLIDLKLKEYLVIPLMNYGMALNKFFMLWILVVVFHGSYPWHSS